MARSRNWNEAQSQNCFSAKRWRRNANHGREEICLEYLIRPFRAIAARANQLNIKASVHGELLRGHLGRKRALLYAYNAFNTTERYSCQGISFRATLREWRRPKSAKMSVIPSVFGCRFHKWKK